MKRCINDAGLALIKEFEGLRFTAYRDVGGVWTIGYGHTGGVYKGDQIGISEAEWLLAQDVAPAEAWVDTRTDPTKTSDNQFAAMASLTFNIGTSAFLGSSVRRQHNLADFAAAAAAFLLWDKAPVDGILVTVNGLLDRRNAERTLYLT